LKNYQTAAKKCSSSWNILYNVLDAAHKYDVLAGDLQQEHSNHLDRLLGEADLIDLADPHYPCQP
jgi:hypothetical protein